MNNKILHSFNYVLCFNKNRSILICFVIFFSLFFNWLCHVIILESPSCFSNTRTSHLFPCYTNLYELWDLLPAICVHTNLVLSPQSVISYIGENTGCHSLLSSTFVESFIAPLSFLPGRVYVLSYDLTRFLKLFQSCTTASERILPYDIGQCFLGLYVTSGNRKL